jgi:hypothetical protein
MTKKLIVTETTFAILFWMNLIQLPLNFLGSDPLFFLKLEPSMILPLIGVTVAGLATHYLPHQCVPLRRCDHRNPDGFRAPAAGSR